MEKVGFIKGDPLFECVKRADAALGELVMALHYMSCEGGMGWNQGERLEPKVPAVGATESHRTREK